MQRVVDGDRDALETVFNDYSGSIKSMAKRIVRNEVLAEDVVQDVFVNFWKSPERFDPNRGSLRTYLITIAHRRAVDVVRSEQARTKREEKIPEDVPPTIDDEVWSLSVSESVRAVLEKLNDNEREAITLAFFGDMSYVEVAAKLGEPEGTVKSRIRTGMRKMSVELAGIAP